MVLASAYDQKCPLRTLVLNTDVTLVQTLRLIILDFCTWKSFSGDRRFYLDAIRRQGKPDMVDVTHTITDAIFILHSILHVTDVYTGRLFPTLRLSGFAYPST